MTQPSPGAVASSGRPSAPPTSAKHITILPRIADIVPYPAVDNIASPLPDFATNLDAALWWHAFGYDVLPLAQGQKFPAIRREPWLTELSPEAIQTHWKEYSNHDVGAVCREDQIVLDADGSEAEAALAEIEQRFGVKPGLIIRTRRGVHHHFRLSTGTYAKADSHSSAAHPDRIDVRAGYNSIMLTPSHNKSVVRLDAATWGDLSQVGQDFIDAVFQHNGRAAPRPPAEIDDYDDERTPADLATLTKLLLHIDPNCGYHDWLYVLMAIYHETGGSADGLALADTWSSAGRSYGGREEIETKWKSFSGGRGNPITVATLIARAKEGGANMAEIMAEEFPLCDTEVVGPPTSPAKRNPFERFSLRGQAAKYFERAQAVTPLLGNLAMKGEATVWYAKHNTGKTLVGSPGTELEFAL